MRIEKRPWRFVLSIARSCRTRVIILCSRAFCTGRPPRPRSPPNGAWPLMRWRERCPICMASNRPSGARSLQWPTAWMDCAAGLEERMPRLSFLTLGVGDAFSARHFSSCLAVTYDGSWLLVDCPHPILKMLAHAVEKAGRGPEIGALQGVILTHLHGD